MVETIKMSFNDFDKLETTVSTMPDILDISRNFSIEDIESLFHNFPDSKDSTGYAPLAIPFLLYLSNKIKNNKEYKETNQNINTILCKYLDLIE